MIQFQILRKNQVRFMASLSHFIHVFAGTVKHQQVFSEQKQSFSHFYLIKNVFQFVLTNCIWNPSGISFWNWTTFRVKFLACSQWAGALLGLRELARPQVLGTCFLTVSHYRTGMTNAWVTGALPPRSEIETCANLLIYSHYSGHLLTWEGNNLMQ